MSVCPSSEVVGFALQDVEKTSFAPGQDAMCTAGPDANAFEHGMGFFNPRCLVFGCGVLAATTIASGMGPPTRTNRALMDLLKTKQEQQQQQPAKNPIAEREPRVLIYQLPWGNKAPRLPACIKIETYCRLMKIPYENVYKTGGNQKLPYLEYQGETKQNKLLGFLNSKFEVDADANLNEKDKASARAFQIMAENNTIWPLMEDLTFNKVLPEKYFKDAVVDTRVQYFKGLVDQYLKNHEISKNNKDEIYVQAEKDFRTLSAFLDDKQFFMGSVPTTADCTVFGLLVCIFHATETSPLAKVIKEDLKNLAEFYDRMTRKFWLDWEDSSHSKNGESTKGNPIANNETPLLIYQLPWENNAPRLPACVKIETYCRLMKIPYQNVYITDGKQKLPYLVYQGQTKQNNLVDFLNSKFKVNADANLSEKVKACARAFQIMVEENMFWSFMTYRMLDILMPKKYFKGLGDKQVQYFKGLVDQCSKNHEISSNKEETYDIGVQDLKAFSAFLDTNKFFMGSEPTYADCTMFGLLVCILDAAENSPLAKVMKEDLKNLVDFCDRMKRKFWLDWNELSNSKNGESTTGSPIAQGVSKKPNPKGKGEKR